ncbi:LegC family aminotransferase [Paenibacillus thermotolerans]|uniref:LegC family aminotransferase n=1 Tax=Paenibacillus thermotolerans TaxID=3027807 RepID=UPI0023674493|nr:MULTISPECIES: LegC family aminotransferase [unclassified Paenibacillus]
MSTQPIVEQIIHVLKETLPAEESFIPLHAPLFEGNEWNYVKECLDTGWVSSVGKYVDLFERKLEEYTGAKHAVAVVNGTAALHVSLLLAGVHRDDEVLIPSLTFIATANAVSYCGAVPHFVDVEEEALGVDAERLKDYLGDIAAVKDGVCINKTTGRTIRAIVPMHTFGHPVKLEPLLEVCEQFRLAVIEDAAESLGSFYKGVHTGNFGLISALSFNGNKIVTTGGGGAILTNDESLAKRAKHITTTAKIPHQWEYVHDQIAFNYRLPNINAALGCAQLEKLPEYVQRKRELASVYRKAFNSIPGVRFFTEAEFVESNYWLNVLILEKEHSEVLPELLRKTNDLGIMTRPAWAPIHVLDMYKDFPRMDLAVTESLVNRIINIPSSVSLGGIDDRA